MAIPSKQNNINTLYSNPCGGTSVLRNQADDDDKNWLEKNIGGLMLGIALGVVGMIVWANWQKKRR